MKNFLKNFSFMGMFMLVLSIILGVGGFTGVAFADGVATKIVDGGEPVANIGSSGGWGTVGYTEFDATLNKGENVVRLFNESGNMPDIDKMELISKNVAVVGFKISNLVIVGFNLIYDIRKSIRGGFYCLSI